MPTFVSSGDSSIERPFLTATQRELLCAVLDRIVPPHGNLPGAGALGLSVFLENVSGRTPDRRRLLNDGLSRIEFAASRRTGGRFDQLDADGQDAVLREVEGQDPVFFDLLVRQCYNGYYTNPSVQEMVGHHRPDPSEYAYQPLNETLLEPQRQRSPFWTQV